MELMNLKFIVKNKIKRSLPKLTLYVSQILIIYPLNGVLAIYHLQIAIYSVGLGYDDLFAY